MPASSSHRSIYSNQQPLFTTCLLEEQKPKQQSQEKKKGIRLERWNKAAGYLCL